MALLGDIRAIVRDTFPKDIEFTLEVPSELHTVMGDSTQIQQVLLNLAVNARDAMPDGGHLTIRASDTTIDAQYAATMPGASSGGHVVIEVETSEPGRGTSSASTSRRRRACPSRRTPTTRTRCRTVAGSWSSWSTTRTRDDVSHLAAHGYRTMEARDGAEAVSSFVDHRDEIDVVLTDMMMPVMDGPATIHALRRLDPDVRIITTSGLDHGDKVTRATTAGVRHVLPKPYSATRLRELLTELLDTAPAGR